ncbi:MAG: FAD:protein FMN transferase [Myxococcota bacterium]
MKRTTLPVALVVLGLVAAAISGARESRVFVRSRYLMGTPVEIKARGSDGAATQKAINAAFGEIARLESLMSHWREDTELARVNRMAGRAPVRVAPELLEVVKRGIGVSRMTGGAFDITIETVSRLWQIEGDAPRVPTADEIKAALGRVGYRHVIVDEAAGTLFLDAPGVRIGLGGVAKGYAVDRAIDILRDHGIRSAMISAGGDMALLGKDGDRPWRIGVKDPRRPGRTVGWFDGADTTVHTSGDYERFAMVKGKRYHHIFNPRTGRPSEGLWSVTVLTRDGTLGDALATGILVLGRREGMRLVESLAGVEAILIDASGKIRTSDAMRPRFHAEAGP